jgi:3-isopropylmalate/(R)-2-methylmalate dehydratase large subunit
MLEDLRAAASILKGRKLAPGVRMIISPSTQWIFNEALKEGLVEVFSSVGATVIPGGCSACPGFVFPLADGERSVGTGTRNEPGRMGSHNAEIFLANPLTVAASAVTGRITDPRELMD